MSSALLGVAPRVRVMNGIAVPYRHSLYTMDRSFYSIESVACFLWVVMLLLAGCSDNPVSPGDELSGGILVTFRAEGEEFNVWITNVKAIQQILDLRDGKSQANIPNGPLIAGAGRAEHNRPWSWHLDPEKTMMAENTIEVCSGVPSFVEASTNSDIY